METYVIIVLCVALTIIAIFYSRLRVKFESLSTKVIECNELNNKISQYEEAFVKVKDAAQSYLNLRQGMETVANENSTLDKLRRLRALLDEHHILQKKNEDEEGKNLSKTIFDKAEYLLESLQIIKLLQSRIAYFHGELYTSGLGEKSEMKIRTDFIDLAFMMMDVIDSIDNSNYIPKHQGINLLLLKEEITIEEASQMAQPVTDDDRVTSQWPRTLHKCLTKWAGTTRRPLIEQKTYLLNGYKFEFQKDYQHL